MMAAEDSHVAEVARSCIVSDLSLSTCPICLAQDSLFRESTERQGRAFTWYECQRCESILLWKGDERWAYLTVGRKEKSTW